MSSNNFIQCIHSWNKGGSIISNYDISLLQPLSCKKKANLKECVAAFVLLQLKTGHSSNGRLKLELWINSIPFKYLSNTLYIRNSWLQVLFWKIPCPLRNGWPQLLSWQRNTVPWKKLFPATKRSNLQGKSYFLGTTTLHHSLFLWASVSLRFLYICQ